VDVTCDSTLVCARILRQQTIPVIMFGGAIDGNPFRVGVRSKGGYASKPNFLDEDNVSRCGLEERREKEVHPSHVNGNDVYWCNNHSDGHGGVTFGGG